ncbi:MAG: Rossmann-like domain-containing protein [Candidatus Bathyarchaeia archaeon]
MAGRVIEEGITIIREKVPNLSEIQVERVCMGLGYAGVQLGTGHVGVCCTLDIRPECCQVVGQAGTLAGRSAMELAEMARSWDVGESVVGVAALNALSQIVLERATERYQISEGNFMDFVEIKRNDLVALVGRIGRLIDRIKEKTKKLYVLERNPDLRREGVLPDIACEEVLPKANIVIITGSSIANKTIDRLLELSKGAREIAVVGPSSGIVPDALFRHGSTIVSGIRVVDPDRVMQIIAEAGGTPQIKSAARFITIRPRLSL